MSSYQERVQQHAEKGKVDFKANSEIRNESEIEKKKFLGNSHLFSSRIKKVIEIKDGQRDWWPQRVPKTIYLKEDPWEKKFRKQQRRGAKKKLPIEKQKNRIKD